MSPVAVRRASTTELTTREIEAIRSLLWAAFADDEQGGFTEDDWQHALGGVHVVAEAHGEIVAHAAVVERDIRVARQPLRTGYVEAVATLPSRQRGGHGTAVMGEVNAIVRDGFQLGALGTGSHAFYERLGWERWRGPSSVRTSDGGERPTPDEDGYILVLRTATTPRITLDAPISCEWRPGDVW